ncbi:hypothetical protein [Coraliomargarita akajimensis]|uniref:Uncharacterized protein n=1 Tax=Coraliomargarita akajimensis (strain DSM 45221 / IAM 15411 / JCM 23193 / KCTC 12865 / 04OKA010-24) TaxID=583355 RepID=D5EKB6_CORAD|nr:hypothetical protein [Coraliomargarita akajimensis]ADE54865.1 hypothetical protein Caka_1847 [Coraliomargarita akajimensis DSM 45221]
MSTTDQDPKQEIQLEDLLRLKRAERPDEAFWGRFDQELHQRMLHSLVEKDPIYIQVLRGLTGRIAQTTGLAAAAAALAFVFVAQNESVPSEGLVEFAAEPEIVQATRLEYAAAQLKAELNAEPVLDHSSGRLEYAIDAMTALHADTGFERDFGPDRMTVMPVAVGADYSVQSLNAGNSPTTLASLVF